MLIGLPGRCWLLLVTVSTLVDLHTGVQACTVCNVTESPDPTNTPIIAWENPPPSGAGRPSRLDYDAIVAALKSRPGTWALVDEYKTNGARKPLLQRGCEVRESKKVGEPVKVYARWPKDAGQ